MILGIDPGLTGAIACDDGQVFDLPLKVKGKGTGFIKNHIDGVAFYNILYQFYLQGVERGEDISVYLEEQVYRKKFKPKFAGGAEIVQGGSSIFSLGDTYGSVRDLPLLLHMKVVPVLPAKWKKALKLDTDKEKCRQLAQTLFPRADISRKKDHNRAEALLLVHYGQMMERDL